MPATTPLSERSSETARHRDRDWMIPACVILVVELGLWWVQYRAGHAYAPMITAYGALAFATLAIVVGVRLLIAMRRLRGTARPLAAVLAQARTEPKRVVSVLVGLQIIALGSSAFSALKAAMPKTVPFWLDVPLARAEHSVFGHHPWEISHAVLGWATPAIDRIYATFLVSHLLAVFTVLTMLPSFRKTQALLSLFLIWLVVGIGGAYALSSAGPIFYDRVLGGQTFAPLMQALDCGAPLTIWTANGLWIHHAFDRPTIGNGLSAMPSMHVGLTLWLALLLRRSRFAIAAWIYLALIWLGSVHLGWHYASDGLVASLGVLLLWHVAGKAVAAWKTRVGAQTSPVDVARTA